MTVATEGTETPAVAKPTGPDRVQELLASLFVAAASLVAALTVLQPWRSPDIRVPFWPALDTPPLLAAIEAIDEHGWYLYNPNLGAPLGQHLNDLPAYANDGLHLGLIKAFSLFADSSGLILNAFLIVSFPLCALSAFAVMRWLGISRAAAVVPAILFSLIPYHFWRIGAGHDFLASYVAVPLGTYLALGVLSGRALVGTRLRGPRPLRWMGRRTLATLAACAVVATTGTYYAAFTLFLVAFALLVAALRSERRRAAVTSGVVVITAIVVVLAAGLAPTFLYRHDHGPNEAVAVRTVRDTEVFSLTLASLVLPPGVHRVPQFARVSTKYAAESDLRAEGSAWPGTAALLGLLLLSLAGLSRLAGGRRSGLLADVRMVDAATLAAGAFILATVGGGSSLIATLVTTQLRGWDRISVFLAFLGLLSVAMTLDRLLDRAGVRGRSGALAVGACLAALLVLGVLDQTSPKFTPEYDEVHAEWTREGRFVQAIEDRLGGHGDVMQLPYLAFPETPGLLRMNDYDPFKAYLHSGRGMRWSYGAMKGRPEDWQGALSRYPFDVQARGAASAGFEGLWVDSFGLADPAAVDAELRRAIGVAPVVSDGGRFSFFDLRPYAGRVPATESRIISEAVLRPLRADFSSGFYPAQTSGRSTWRWMSTHGTIRLSNPARAPRRVRLRAHLRAPAPATVVVRYDGAAVETLRLAGPPVRLDVSVTVPPGSHVLTVATDGPPAPRREADDRDLRLQLLEPSVLDAALNATGSDRG
jgi:phosphoglycerol transferase